MARNSNNNNKKNSTSNPPVQQQQQQPSAIPTPELFAGMTPRLSGQHHLPNALPAASWSAGGGMLMQQPGLSGFSPTLLSPPPTPSSGMAPFGAIAMTDVRSSCVSPASSSYVGPPGLVRTGSNQQLNNPTFVHGQSSSIADSIPNTMRIQTSPLRPYSSSTNQQHFTPPPPPPPSQQMMSCSAGGPVTTGPFVSNSNSMHPTMLPPNNTNNGNLTTATTTLGGFTASSSCNSMQQTINNSSSNAIGTSGAGTAMCSQLPYSSCQSRLPPHHPHQGNAGTVESVPMTARSQQSVGMSQDAAATACGRNRSVAAAVSMGAPSTHSRTGGEPPSPPFTTMHLTDVVLLLHHIYQSLNALLLSSRFHRHRSSCLSHNQWHGVGSDADRSDRSDPPLLARRHLRATL